MDKTFPTENTEVDGYYYTAPVKSYAPNGYNLYDMKMFGKFVLIGLMSIIMTHLR